MTGTDLVVLGRDCMVTLIPSGRRAILGGGEQVQIVQRLGDSVTIQVDRGPLARVDGPDLDALGLERPDGERPRPGSAGPLDRDVDQESVLEELRSVFDPEIPVNVVDLGLVYRCEVIPLEGGGRRVEIDMSMTAPGCGMGDVLCDDARARVLGLPGVAEVDVQLVWDPPWDMSRLSEAARLELGLW